MDVFPKFIVEDDKLIIGKCTFHKEMTEGGKIKGGGFFEFDSATNTFTLSGESYDFGTASVEDIKSCIDNNQVWARGLYREMNDHNFKYHTGTSTITLKTLP